MKRIMKYFGLMLISDFNEYKEGVNDSVIKVLKESDKPTKIYRNDTFSSIDNEVIVGCNIIIMSPVVNIATCSFFNSKPIIGNSELVYISGCTIDNRKELSSNEPILKFDKKFPNITL